MICKRLAPNMDKAKDNDRRYMHIYKPYNKGQEFKGILRYLTEKTKGNIHDNETIEITSNSIYDEDISNHPKNSVDYKCYESADKENFTVVFDFKNKAVQLSNYSIKTYYYAENGGHLKSWSIEVSNDKNNWEKVDEHTDDKSLNGSFAVATFDTKKSDNFYRFIRLRQTGKNWSNDYDTPICLIVFYGKIKQINSI